MSKVVVFGADDRFDIPIAGLSPADDDTFVAGDELFDLPLPPVRRARPALHAHVVRRLSRPRARAARASSRRWSPSRPTASRRPPISRSSRSATPCTRSSRAARRRPSSRPRARPDVKVTIRVGPPILGRGYIEAVADAEIERVAAEQAARTDAIHGRVNRVTYASEPNPDTRFHAHQPGDMVIGRFGLKARIATVDDFTADALQGDMGITSPLRPTEIPNPDGLTDDLKPGVDVTIDSVNARANYVRTTAIPKRDAAADPRGAQLFADAKCASATCPTLEDARRLSRSRSSPASTRPSTPTCCCTTWATRSPTASSRATRRGATGARRRSSACASTRRSCTTGARTTSTRPSRRTRARARRRTRASRSTRR